MSANARTALVLTGGGARAAYQVGVLTAIRDLLPDDSRNPFPIICGVSAGAINATVLGCHAQNFRAGVAALHDVWWNIHAEQVYRCDPLSLIATSSTWLAMFFLGGWMRVRPRSLLDNTPLAELLSGRLQFPNIDRAIASGSLYALALTASGYTTGQSVSFFQARADVLPWQRANRMGLRVRIGLEHLLASSAIPFLFPAVRIHREFFGDGSMRQVAPLSAPIRLGARRILVVGAGRMMEPPQRQSQAIYPSLAQVAGHALSSIFLDALPADIERMEGINRMLERIPVQFHRPDELDLRPISALTIAPSQRLDVLAAQHSRSLPRTVRTLLSGVGATNRHGGALTSYLLFEQRYTRALIEMGYADTMAQESALRSFLELSEPKLQEVVS